LGGGRAQTKTSIKLESVMRSEKGLSLCEEGRRTLSSPGEKGASCKEKGRGKKKKKREQTKQAAPKNKSARRYKKRVLSGTLKDFFVLLEG